MRTNLWLLGIALVLGVFCGVRFFNLSRYYADTGEAPRLFPGFTPDRVSQVILARQDAEAMAARSKEREAAQAATGRSQDEEPIWKHETVLYREADEWKVLVHQDQFGGRLGFSATKRNIEELLEKLRDVPASRSDIVTDDPRHHEAYEVDQKQAIHIEARDKEGKQLAYLLVGRKPADPSAGQALFVRQSEMNPVIRYDVGWWFLDADRNTWLDKNVLSLERDKIKRIEMNNPKGRWVVERDKQDRQRWRLLEPIEGLAKASDVDSIVNYLANLYMDELISPLSPQAEAKYAVGSGARYVVTVHMDDGQTRHVLRVGNDNPDKEGQLFAVVHGKPFVITIGRYIVEVFRKTADEIRDLEAEKAEEEAATQPTDPPADASRPVPGETTEEPGEPSEPGEPTEPGEPSEPEPEQPGQG